MKLTLSYEDSIVLDPVEILLEKNAYEMCWLSFFNHGYDVDLIFIIFNYFKFYVGVLFIYYLSIKN